MNKWTRKRLVLLKKIFLRNNVALASFPRSGNTWLSKLLEALSGERAGSIYQDVVFPRPAFGIVIKTHKLDGRRYNRFIHLLRNPFDSIASLYDFRHHFVSEKAEDWTEHVRLQSRKWREHTEYWMGQNKPHIRIRYEDLRAQPVEAIEGVAAFLGLSATEKDIEEAVEACRIEKLRAISSKRGEDAADFFRKGQTGQGRSRFSAAEIAIVETEAGELMKRFGYSIETTD